MLITIITAPNPLGWILQKTVAAKALSVTKENDVFNSIVRNVNKQGWILTIAFVLSAWYIIENGPMAIFNDSVILAIAGGLTVAWFVITFSSIKELYIDDATDLTFLMFTAFTVPWTLIATSSIIAAATGQLAWSVATMYTTIIVFAWVAAAKYDTLDLVRGNLDELALEFYQRGVGGRGGIRVKNSE